MTYKTLLAHLNEEHRAAAVIDVATALAARFDAHLVGLCVMPPIIIVPGGEGGGGAVIEDHREAYRQNMDRMRATFTARTSAAGISAEWREIDAQDANPFGDVGTVAVAEARTADLVIAGQENPDWLLSGQLDVVEPLILESGRPVLLIPRTMRDGWDGGRVLVAWDGRREATRALHDALPLLMAAKQVDVVAFNEPRSDRPHAPDITETIRRHGVKSTKTQHVEAAGNVGAALLDKARSDGADLIVMGCYGHSRLREFVFGGASRHVLENMAVPILMSH